ncbi:MAG: ABC transporter ATP-binding protein/permease [Lachnospiraceae bacterium]|nr:ABC transporter ATP-binding protein/permease [Lachnospiraceae bacterium]
MWKLLKYMKAYRKESFCAPLFKLLEASFELLVPLVMARIIDVGIKNQDTAYILRMCLLMVALGVIGLVCAVTAQYFSAKAAVGFSAKLREVLFAHVQALSFTEQDDIGTSTLITRMTSDINQVQSGVNLFLRLFLRSPFIVFGAMAMAFTIDVKAAFVFVVVIPILCVIVFGIMLISIPMYRRVQERLDAVVRLTRENLLGVRVIRAFCREPEEVRDFEGKNELLVKAQLLSGRISAMMNPMTYVVINMGLVVLLYVGATRVDAGFITQGSVVALVNYMSQILVELVKLANLIITVTKAIACGNRIQSVLDVPAGMETPARMEESEQEAAEPWGRADTQGSAKVSGGVASKTETQKSTGKPSRKGFAEIQAESSVGDEAAVVAFDHVNFSYRGAGADALSDLTFAARRGETIGIIGGTGSGKTSLVSLIPRFYDVRSGSVKVDGRDVREYPLEELRKKVGIVMQKPVLFKGTIRSNLLWGNENAADEDLIEAVRAAQAEDVVLSKGQETREESAHSKSQETLAEAKTPHSKTSDRGNENPSAAKSREKKSEDAALIRGLDAAVEQEGRNFSGGQKQRLTIARALVRHPEILILDDSASALDFATDARLRGAIRRLNEKGDLTVFIVSQRTSSIAHADKILVLEDGHVAGIGTHKELLASCEVYQETHYSQFPKTETAGEAGLKKDSSQDFSRTKSVPDPKASGRNISGRDSASGSDKALGRKSSDGSKPEGKGVLA